MPTLLYAMPNSIDLHIATSNLKQRVINSNLNSPASVDLNRESEKLKILPRDIPIDRKEILKRLESAESRKKTNEGNVALCQTIISEKSKTLFRLKVSAESAIAYSFKECKSLTDLVSMLKKIRQNTKETFLAFEENDNDLHNSSHQKKVYDYQQSVKPLLDEIDQLLNSPDIASNLQDLQKFLKTKIFPVVNEFFKMVISGNYRAKCKLHAFFLTYPEYRNFCIVKNELNDDLKKLNVSQNFLNIATSVFNCYKQELIKIANNDLKNLFVNSPRGNLFNANFQILKDLHVDEIRFLNPLSFLNMLTFDKGITNSQLLNCDNSFIITKFLNRCQFSASYLKKKVKKKIEKETRAYPEFQDILRILTGWLYSEDSASSPFIYSLSHCRHPKSICIMEESKKLEEEDDNSFNSFIISLYTSAKQTHISCSNFRSKGDLKEKKLGLYYFNLLDDECFFSAFRKIISDLTPYIISVAGSNETKNLLPVFYNIQMDKNIENFVLEKFSPYSLHSHKLLSCLCDLFPGSKDLEHFYYGLKNDLNESLKSQDSLSESKIKLSKILKTIAENPYSYIFKGNYSTFNTFGLALLTYNGKKTLYVNKYCDIYFEARKNIPLRYADIVYHPLYEHIYEEISNYIQFSIDEDAFDFLFHLYELRENFFEDYKENIEKANNSCFCLLT